MDSLKQRSSTPSKSRLSRTFAKVLHLKTATGALKAKSRDKVKNDRVSANNETNENSNVSLIDEVRARYRADVEALLAKLFAGVSTVKAAYAQIQFSQAPYDAAGIQSGDEIVVSELKNLSELKQSYLKKQFDALPEEAFVSAEIQENKSLLKTYDIMAKKLESQLKLKNSEIDVLREKLEETIKENQVLEKRLHPSGIASVLDNLHLSGLNPSHFITIVGHTIKVIRSFVRLMISEMETAGWDFDLAASSIEPGVVYWKDCHKCFAFEAFVCREMFVDFNYPNFNFPNEPLPESKRRQQRMFFHRFTELKYRNPRESLAGDPKSTFGKVYRVKYLRLVHPKMESSFFGDLAHRNLINSGEFLANKFFDSFADMAKWVWLLHCLAFSFPEHASVFQVSKRSQFSEVYMESVIKKAVFLSDETEPRVAFTVVPGFRVGKTVIQSQVYLSQYNDR